jgi:hypothetical protein
VTEKEIKNSALFESASSRSVFMKICTFSLSVNPGPCPFILKIKYVFLNLPEKQYEEEEDECKAQILKEAEELICAAV